MTRLKVVSGSRFIGNRLPHPIYASMSVPYGNTFALVGGWNGTSSTDTVYLYEPGSDTWTLVNDRIAVPIHHHAAFPVRQESFPKC